MTRYKPKREYNEEKTILGYIPHGVNPKTFYKITAEAELEYVNLLRKKLLGDAQTEFVVLYNNRNIRRKNPGDVILAFQKFVRELKKEQQNKAFLIMHTQPIDENGTDLMAIARDIASDVNIIFSHERIPPNVLNQLYNLSDVVINLCSNEGFGLGTLEAIMTERMIVANVQGGLQDQMGFKDDSGAFLSEETHFEGNWGTNSDGRYKTHGEWVVPVYPNNFNLNGSPQTPYIFDSRCDWRDAAVALRQIYDMSKEERERRGKLGREYAMTGPYNSAEMARRFIIGIEYVLDHWKPKARFGVYKNE